MADSLQLLFEEPELVDALKLWEPEYEFAPATLKRAHGYLDPGVISKVKAEPLDEDHDDDYAPFGSGITVWSSVSTIARPPVTLATT